MGKRHTSPTSPALISQAAAQDWNAGICKNVVADVRFSRHSFHRYVFRTLRYAGRALRPLYACSLDDPMAPHARERELANVVRDPETNEIGLYESRKAWTT